LPSWSKSRKGFVPLTRKSPSVPKAHHRPSTRWADRSHLHQIPHLAIPSEVNKHLLSTQVHLHLKKAIDVPPVYPSIAHSRLHQLPCFHFLPSLNRVTFSISAAFHSEESLYFLFSTYSLTRSRVGRTSNAVLLMLQFLASPPTLCVGENLRLDVVCCCATDTTTTTCLILVTCPLVDR